MGKAAPSPPADLLMTPHTPLKNQTQAGGATGAARRKWLMDKWTVVFTTLARCMIAMASYVCQLGAHFSIRKRATSLESRRRDIRSRTGYGYFEVEPQYISR